MLEPLVPIESSQDEGNSPVRSRPEENYPEWKPAFSRMQLKSHVIAPCAAASHAIFDPRGEL